MADALRLEPAGAGLLDRGTEGKECQPETVLLSVENMRCGGCMLTIERTLRTVPGVLSVRANLTSKRVSIKHARGQQSARHLIEVLAQAGYTAAALADETAGRDDAHLDDLLRRLAVAGFGAANVMLLSVSVWAGLASDMDQALQTMLHWLSALIAVPVVAYAAQPFFRSAVGALAARRLNMDVPISLGILLATGMSIAQTARGTDQVYFDAAVMLTFFLLIGRFLDERMRLSARGAAQNLMAFKALDATIVEGDGSTQRVDARLVVPGMHVLVARGERIPVDGNVVRGRADIEEALITGETAPRMAGTGDPVHAGTVNLSDTIEIVATRSTDASLLAEIGRLMANAEQSRGRYRRLADRAAAIYAPAVHLLGFATFSGWMLAGASWEQALTCAIAVLIITCPCALALAVPAVQVAATSRLFASGVIMKAADGLERLAEVDAIIFDKTGTLTTGTLTLSSDVSVSDDIIAKAAGLAAASRHPYAQALVAEARRRSLAVRVRDGVEEIAGSGLRWIGASGEMRLGSADWAGGADVDADSEQAGLWFCDELGERRVLTFVDTLRPDARETIDLLSKRGFHMEILSGDRRSAVGAVAGTLGIGNWQGQVKPDEKLKRIEVLHKEGRRVLMVGDGLNDAPALAAGHASLSPSSAADVTQNAADGVVQGRRLGPVGEALGVAKAARSLAFQNFAIAIAYNIVCVPLAAAGYVTPLIAALAMSGSSIAVTANAVRLHVMKVGA